MSFRFTSHHRIKNFKVVQPKRVEEIRVVETKIEIEV